MLSYFDFTPETDDRDKDQDGLRRPCAVCKAVHIACDRGRPCGRCSRLGKEHMCQDPPLQRRGRKPLILRSVHKHKDEEVKTSPYGSTQRPSAMADSQGRIIATSPEFLQLLGYSSHEELLGIECQILPAGPNQPDFTGLLRGDMLSLLQAGGSEQERDVVVDTLWVNSRHEPMVLSTQVISYIRDGALICSRLNILRVRPTSSASSSSGVPHVNSTGSVSGGVSNSSSEPNSPGSTSSVSSAPGSPRQVHSHSPSPARFIPLSSAGGSSLVPPSMTRPRSHSSPNPPPVPFPLSMPPLPLRVSNPGVTAAASAPPSPQPHLHNTNSVSYMRQQQQQQIFPQHITTPHGVFPFAVPLVDCAVSPRPPSPKTTASANVPAISISLYPSNVPRHHSNPSMGDISTLSPAMLMMPSPHVQQQLQQQQQQQQLQQQLQQQQQQMALQQFASQSAPAMVVLNSSAGWLSQAHSSGASSDHTPTEGDLSASLTDDALTGIAAEEFASSLLIWDDVPQQQTSL